jgi:hypothetical protein
VACYTRIRSGPLVKTAVDQTLKRSITTKLLTTQPPPLLTINGVVGSGSLLQREPLQSIRQAGYVVPDELGFTKHGLQCLGGLYPCRSVSFRPRTCITTPCQDQQASGLKCVESDPAVLHKRDVEPIDAKGTEPVRASCGHSDSGFPSGLICASRCLWQMLGVLDGQASSCGATSAGC